MKDISMEFNIQLNKYQKEKDLLNVNEIEIIIKRINDWSSIIYFKVTTVFSSAATNTNPHPFRYHNTTPVFSLLFIRRLNLFTSLLATHGHGITSIKTKLFYQERIV